MKKTAIVLHGNLRTFFMPTRENSNLRVCDIVNNNIIIPNDVDVFVSTDTNDYYLNDCQWFRESTIDIVNNDPFRLFYKVGFKPLSEGKDLIEKSLTQLFGDRLKGIIINETNDDLSNDPKCQLLQTSKALGASPIMITGQYKKLLACEKLLAEYEQNNNINYDVIIKSRFDTAFNVNCILDVNKFDTQNMDVYAPTVKPPLVHDFFAFGNKKGMIPYLKMYENLGCTLPENMYMYECRRDGMINYFGNDKTLKLNCKQCKKSDMISIGDVSIASEHHIYHLFNKLNIKFTAVNYHTYIYRYRDVAYNNTIDNIIQNELKLSGITLINHTAGCDVGVRNF